MNKKITWELMNNTKAIFYATTVNAPDGTPRLVCSSPEDTIQEDYVEEGFQEEAMVLFFTTKEGAMKHAKFLVANYGYEMSEMGITAGTLSTLFRLLDILNKKMVDDIGRSIRAEIYHMVGDDCVDSDIIYSNWVVKH